MPNQRRAKERQRGQSPRVQEFSVAKFMLPTKLLMCFDLKKNTHVKTENVEHLD